MMGFKMPWWYILILFILMLPIFPFIGLNKLTNNRIKVLKWTIQKYLEVVVDRFH